MTRLALALALIASPAVAEPLMLGTLTDDTRLWPGTISSGYRDSYVRLGPPVDPAAVATLTFDNRSVHHMDEEFSLTFNGIEITVLFDWQADGGNDERLTVLVPPGYAAVPPETQVPEDQIGIVQIVKWEGM